MVSVHPLSGVCVCLQINFDSWGQFDDAWRAQTEANLAKDRASLGNAVGEGAEAPEESIMDAGDHGEDEIDEILAGGNAETDAPITRADLNPGQTISFDYAIRKIFIEDEQCVLLIDGPPGTGKTRTCGAIEHYCKEHGVNVLAT